MLAPKKPKLRKKSHVSIGAMICLSIAFYFVYYLLVQDIIAGALSSAFISSENSIKWHVLTIALVPVYISLLIFGGSIVSIYLGSALQRWLARFTNKKVSVNPFSRPKKTS
jgi:hypothetical protein